MIFEVCNSYIDLFAIQRLLAFLPLGQDPNQITQPNIHNYVNE